MGNLLPRLFQEGEGKGGRYYDLDQWSNDDCNEQPIAQSPKARVGSVRLDKQTRYPIKRDLGTQKERAN